MPFYLTSNPLIAKQFSAVILGYIRDCMRNEGRNSIDTSEPFYIFDLGAGSGRLGYLILKHLIPMVRDSISPDLRICYVMTDMVESNIEFYKTHPLLEKYVKSGNLDFAFYHHTHKGPLDLICSGEKLEDNKIVNPIALVCTYYFDTVPQDLFKANKGILEEGRISISLPADDEDPTLGYIRGVLHHEGVHILVLQPEAPDTRYPFAASFIGCAQNDTLLISISNTHAPPAARNPQ